MNKFFLTLIFISGSFIAFCQTQIKGVILNEQGNRVPDILVKIAESSKTTFSNYQGEFTLEIPDSLLNISFIIENDRQIADIKKISDKEFQIIIKTNIFDLSLDELLDIEVTTAGKTAEKISEIPASVVVITRQEIEDYGYSSFSEILENVAGIYLIDDYYWLGNKNFGVRGFFSTGQFNDMVVLVDGVSQLSDKYGDYPDVKINVPVQAIEKIEIIKGPMSVIYGSGAFFGAINIITKHTDSDLKNSISSSYGSYNTKKLNARVEGKEKNINFTVDAALNSTHGIDVPFTDLTTKTNVLEYVGLEENATTAGQMDDSRKYFNLNLEYKNATFTLSAIETKKDIFDAQPNYYDGSEMTTKATNISFRYKKDFSQKVNSQFKIGYYSHGHTIDYSVFGPFYYEIDAQNTNSMDCELDFFFNFSKKLFLTTGLYNRTVLNIHQISDFGYYGLNYGAGEIRLPKDEHYSTNALFSQLKYSPFEKLKIVAGLRLEHLDNYNMSYTRGIVSEDPADNRDPQDSTNRQIINAMYSPQNNGFAIIPRLAVLLSLNNYNVIKLLYGTALKQPSFSENYRQLPENRPQLEAASITTYELNYLSKLTKNINLTVSVFYNQLDKLIVGTNLYDQTTGKWDIYSSNSGKMKTIGFEIGTKIKFSDIFTATAKLCYQNSTNLKKGYENIALSYSPKLLANASILYRFSQNISISFTGKYVDKMETLWKTETTPDAGARIAQASKAYTLINAHLRINNLFSKGIFTEFSLKNILDSEVRYPTTSSNAWADKGYLGYSRNCLISLGISF